MKILSVIWAPLGDTGSSRRICNITRLLHSLGHDVRCVQYVRRSTWENSGGNKFRLNNVPLSTVFVSGHTAHIRHLLEICRDKYDLVYGNAHGSTFVSLLGKLERVPLVFDMHGSLVEESKLLSELNVIRMSLQKFFLNAFIETTGIVFSDKIVCVSRKMIRFLHRHKGVPLEKMVYVTNGIDLDFFSPVDEEKVSELKKQLEVEDKLVFSYIGSFQKWQGVENFIEAAKRIHDRRVAFLIIGGDKRRMEKEGKIIFVPKVPSTQVPLFYSVGDIMVLPRPRHLATEIAAPTKFAEYLAMSKPVLVTNVGDAADHVRRHNCGIVVENNAVKSLMKGIQEFRGKSEKELKKMGRNSRRLAENEFDWNKIKDNLHKIMEF